MSYESWAMILQNKLVEELDPKQAKMLYEQDMFRAEKVQTAAKARAGRSGRAGGGVRKRKVAAATFKPSDLEGLSLWLDADDASTISESGGAISGWTNKAPAPYAGLFDFVQGTGSAQPTLVASGQNSRSIVRFDPAKDEYMTGVGSDAYPSPAASDDDFTIIAVCKFDTGHTFNAWGDFFLSWTLDSNYDRNPGYQAIHIGNGGTSNTDQKGFYAHGSKQGGSWAVQTLTATDPIKEVHQVMVYRNQTGGGFRINGADGFTPGGGLGADSAPLENAYTAGSARKYAFLGGARLDAGTPNSMFSGDICEILIYADNLSDSDCETVEAYLAAKWGITLS